MRMAPSREWRPGRVSTRNGGVASRPARSCYAPPPHGLRADAPGEPRRRPREPTLRRGGAGRRAGPPALLGRARSRLPDQRLRVVLRRADLARAPRGLSELHRPHRSDVLGEPLHRRASARRIRADRGPRSGFAERHGPGRPRLRGRRPDQPQAAPVPVLIWALGRAWMPVPRPRRLVMLGILCVAMAVPLSAWTVRKYLGFLTLFRLSTNSGVNLLIGNNPAATGKYLPLELFPDDSGPEREPYLDREALRLALEFMTRHPMAALQIWPRKLWHLYGRDGDGFDWTMAGIGTDDRLRTLVWRVAQINKVYYLVLVLISGVGFLHFASTRRKADAASAAGMLPFWLTALFTGVYLICFADPRFHFPLMPWVVMYGAWLISLGLSGPPVSGSIGGSYGPMGSDGCRGTRLQRSGRCDGGTGGPAGSAEATGENVHRASPPALTRLPTPPLLGPEPRPPSQRAVHRVSGDCVRRDTPAETPLARPGPLVLGSI